MTVSMTAAEQLAFVTRWAPPGGRLLEVGCGSGALARRLGAAGWSVTALDLVLAAPDPARGVTWVEGDFLRHHGGPYDAVVFTASLHHIHPLDEALDRARAQLAPGGLLLADDFDLDAPDQETARWYYEVQELLAAAGAFPGDHVHGGPDDPPLDRWRAEHEHPHEPPLHTGAAMLAAARRHFDTTEEARGPYLYRYLCAGLSDSGLCGHVLAAERRRIAAGALRPVGLRLVSRASASST